MSLNYTQNYDAEVGGQVDPVVRCGELIKATPEKAPRKRKGFDG